MATVKMTPQEVKVKNKIVQILKEQGYPTYAKILSKIPVWLTNSPKDVAFMAMGDGVYGNRPIKRGTMVINKTLDWDQVSTVVRHEILHIWFDHETRALKYLAKKRGLDYDDLADNNLDDIIQQLKNEMYSNRLENTAGDFDISNNGYTDEDKEISRHLIFNGQIVKGLITEDSRPDFVGKSFEEMFDALRKEKNTLKGSFTRKSDNNKPTVFVSEDGRIFGDPNGEAGKFAKSMNVNESLIDEGIKIHHGTFKNGEFVDEDDVPYNIGKFKGYEPEKKSGISTSNPNRLNQDPLNCKRSEGDGDDDEKNTNNNPNTKPSDKPNDDFDDEDDFDGGDNFDSDSDEDDFDDDSDFDDDGDDSNTSDSNRNSKNSSKSKNNKSNNSSKKKSIKPNDYDDDGDSTSNGDDGDSDSDDSDDLNSDEDDTSNGNSSIDSDDDDYDDDYDEDDDYDSEDEDEDEDEEDDTDNEPQVFEPTDEQIFVGDDGKKYKWDSSTKEFYEVEDEE